jgi:hypothetical protein
MSILVFTLLQSDCHRLVLLLYVQILHLTSGTHARSWKTPVANFIKYNLTNRKVQMDLSLFLSACMGTMKLVAGIVKTWCTPGGRELGRWLACCAYLIVHP